MSVFGRRYLCGKNTHNRQGLQRVFMCVSGAGGVLSPSAGLELDLLGIQSDRQVAFTRVRVAGLT